MYIKLMIRGLLRHKKSGKRLFILLALCSLAIMFCLGFRDSFSQRYRELGIDVSTAHLQILPADSPKTRANSFEDRRQGLMFLAYTPELADFLRKLDGVAGAMPIIETGAALFGLDGESTGYTPSLIGVDPASFHAMLPAARLVEGEDVLAWPGEGTDVPLFRPVPEPMFEQLSDNTVFERWNFRLEGPAWESWKQKMASDFPALFPQKNPADFSEAKGDPAFLAAMTALLSRSDLLQTAQPPADAAYDWRQDDARAALSAQEKLPSNNDIQLKKLKAVRKIYLQSLWPQVIRHVYEGIALDTAYTMAVPPARGDDLLGQPVVIPVRMTAYVQRMPLYFFNFYVDNAVLHHYLDIKPAECTSLLIRVKALAEIPRIKAEISSWLKQHNLDYAVMDSEELGKIFLSTAMAFDIITLIIMVLFVATVVVFVVNTVMLSLIKRRREIGTSIALGLSPFQNALLIFGEMAVLVTVAWFGAAIAGTGLELWMSQSGLPGMIFFPGGRLYFAYNPWHSLQTLLIVLPTALAATAFALRNLGKAKAVDLLKEAS